MAVLLLAIECPTVVGLYPFVDAELTRIEEQVELIREGLLVASDASSLSQRIDQIGNTLGNTNQWIKQQQELYGQTEVLLDEPPPVVLEAPGEKA